MTRVPSLNEERGLTFKSIGSILSIRMENYVDVAQGKVSKLGKRSEKSPGDRENQRIGHSQGT